MEVLHKTQFAQFEKDFNKLPAFLQKKLQEAIATEVKKADAEALAKKQEKAEQRRKQKLEKQQLRKLQERINFEDTVERGRRAKETKKELLTQIQNRKQIQADQVYGDELARKINKGYTLGERKVQEAKEARAAKMEQEERERQRKRNERIVLNYPNASLDLRKMEKQNKLVEKHYNILKKLNVRGFHSQRETLKKQEAIELKLAKAASRHQQVLEEKKAKAIRAACIKVYDRPEVVPLEARIQTKQEAAEARRAEVLQQKIDKARESYALSKKSTDSQSALSTARNDEELRQAQKELSACYEIIRAQKAANFKLLEELNELKKTQNKPKRAQAWVIDQRIPSAFRDSSNPRNAETKERTVQTEDAEEKSWTML